MDALTRQISQLPHIYIHCLTYRVILVLQELNAFPEVRHRKLRDRLCFALNCKVRYLADLRSSHSLTFILYGIGMRSISSSSSRTILLEAGLINKSIGFGASELDCGTVVFASALVLSNSAELRLHLTQT